MTLSMMPPTDKCPDGEVHRTVLPESEYPELYALRREERWLEKTKSDAHRDELFQTLETLGYTKQ